jgi:hypothetical protein
LDSQEVQETEKEKKDEEKAKEKKKEPEPNFQLMENPARVMPAQLKVFNMPETCRYTSPSNRYVLLVCVCDLYFLSVFLGPAMKLSFYQPSFISIQSEIITPGCFVLDRISDPYHHPLSLNVAGIKPLNSGPAQSVDRFPQ